MVLCPFKFNHCAVCLIIVLLEDNEIAVSHIEFRCDIWWLSVGSRLGQRPSKSACFVVPPLFRADSGTNLIKQGESVKGRPCGSVAQLAECSHGKREALGSSPGRATIFSSPVTLSWYLSVWYTRT